MRKIEKIMLSAVNERIVWRSNNTSVNPIDDVNSAVYLHGNHIADVNSRTGLVMVNTITLANWPTPTTKSRLRALGANVTTKRGQTFLDYILIA
jgi:hypothetical protein